MYSAPVGNEKPIKAPFVFEYVTEKMLVFGTPYGVYLVIGAHHCVRMGFFYRNLKSAQIYFAHCSFVNFDACIKTVFFLVVHCVVLRTSAYALFLKSEHKLRRKLARDYGIFRIVFKVSAAENIAFYVHSGTEYH